MFTYCNNNPIKFADTTGKFPVIAVIIGIGVTVIGALLVPSQDEIQADADIHYSRNERNETPESVDVIMNEYDKQAEWADKYHEDTSGTQGAEAIYNDKYLSPNGGHLEVIVCSPPGKDPYIVDETVDVKNMGTYNYISNTIPLVYHALHFVFDMVPYYLYGNTSEDDTGLLKWMLN